MYRLEGSSGNPVGFASELRLLVDALQMSFEAQFMEDFVSGSNLFWCILWYSSLIHAGLCFKVGSTFWHMVQYFPFFCPFAVENPGSDNIKSAMVIPSPTVRDRVLKELFIDGM